MTGHHDEPPWAAWQAGRGGPRGRGGPPGAGSWGEWTDGRPGGHSTGHGGRQGPPPWVAGLLGLGQAGARGPKVRRGDVRTAILDVLAAEPMNGYQVIGQIAERTQGAWKPSPGSVYPTVQQLEDEGLVEGVEEAGRRVLRLTAAGQAWVQSHPDEVAATWQPFDEPEADSRADGGSTDLKPVIGRVMGAVWQVVVSGTAQQQAEAAEILADTRRRLYALLADPDEEE